MEKDKSIIGYVFLICILFAVICYLIYYIFVGRNKNKDVNYETVSQSELERIVSDELYVLFKKNVRSLSDISNDDKMFIVMNGLRNISNEVSYSKSDVDNYFSSTSLGNLGLNHGHFDIYVFDGDYYRIIDPSSISNMIYDYSVPVAKKVSNFSNDNGVYTLSYKYIFSDDDLSDFGYGSISDMFNATNSIFKIISSDRSNESVDAQKYLDSNYYSIKDKLATYNYVFVNENNCIKIVDFYIN